MVKGTIRFCAPRLAGRATARVRAERAWEFQAAGAALLVFAVLLSYSVYTG